MRLSLASLALPCALFLALACSPADEGSADSPDVDLPSEETDLPPATAERAPCDTDYGTIADGELVTRTRYELAYVNWNEVCRSEEQKARCSDGTLGSFTGSFSEESCEVIAPLHCEGAEHGSYAHRTRFAAPSVPFDGQCESEVQEALCQNGELSAFTGSYLYEDCQVEAPRACLVDGSYVAHGSVVERVRFEASSVAYDQSCSAETQWATCHDGVLGGWSGSYVYEACEVQSPLGCGDTAHGESITRTRYQQASVAWNAQCVSEVQRATCVNGQLGGFTGSFQFESCAPLQPLDCGSVKHGQREQRTAYRTASVPHGGTCEQEQQTRECVNGVLGAWSGSFAFTSCQQDGPLDCGSVKHGELATRTRFRSRTVAWNATCESEQQEATCNNGQLGAFSGSFAFDSCTPDRPLACGNVAHGAESTRTRFREAQVAWDGTCVSEVQRATCENGVLSAFTGSFAFASCSPATPLDCGSTRHGGTRTRTQFRTSSVAWNESCQSELQSATCENGVLSAFSGTFAFASCTPERPLDCGAVKHGDYDTRVRYERALVAWNEQCVEEWQGRQCENGAFKEWFSEHGYQFDTCTVPAPRDCAELRHGTTESRVRFREARLAWDGRCTSETQTRSCVDGAQSAWSGTFAAESCSYDDPPQCNGKARGFRWLNPTPQGNDLTSVWGTSDGITYAVGPMDTVLRRSAAGLWERVETGHYGDFEAVWASSASNVYVAGKAGMLLRFDGTVWHELQTGTQEDLFAVWGSDAQNVFVVGAKGTVLHFDGSRFHALTSNTTQALYGVWGSSSRDVFFAGQAGTLLHYDGERLRAHALNTQDDLYAVHGVSSREVYVSSHVAVYRYDGNLWRKVRETGNLESLYGLWTSAPGKPVAVGQFGTVLSGSERGAAMEWSKVLPAFARDLRAVWGHSENDAYAVGDSGLILHFDGQAWREESKAITRHALSAIWGQGDEAFVTGKGGVFALDVPEGTLSQVTGSDFESYVDLWALAADDLYALEEKRVVHFDGERWSTVFESQTTLRGIWGSSDRDIHVVGDGGRVWRFDGQSFRSVQQSFAVDLYDVWGTAPDNVYAVGALGTILRFDGRVWTRVFVGRASDHTDVTLHAVWGSSADGIWASGGSRERGRSLMVRFNGSSWTPYPSDGESLEALGGIDRTHYFVGGSKGGLWRFDGTGWQYLYTASQQGIRGVFAPNRAEVYVVGDHGSVLHYCGHFHEFDE